MSLTGYNLATIQNPFTETKYRHVALSISGTTHTLYLDGSAVVTNQNAGNIFASYTSTINNLYIGCAGDLSYGYNGMIDDFKIWNRTLSTADISAIYLSNKPIIQMPSTILNLSTIWFSAFNSSDITTNGSNVVTAIKDLKTNTNLNYGIHGTSITKTNSNQYIEFPMNSLYGGYWYRGTYLSLPNYYTSQYETFFYIYSVADITTSTFILGSTKDIDSRRFSTINQTFSYGNISFTMPDNTISSNKVILLSCSMNYYNSSTCIVRVNGINYSSKTGTEATSLVFGVRYPSYLNTLVDNLQYSSQSIVKVYEFIGFYQKQLTLSEVQSIEDYLLYKWAGVISN
jgi:hypothetical protein